VEAGDEVVELESAARWELLQDQTVAGYVQQRVYKHRLMEKVDGTGKVAVVVFRDGGWASPDPVRTVEYPVLTVRCWADPTRDATGGYSVWDAEDKAWALWRAVANRLHGVRDQWWGARGTNPGLRVITCSRWTEPFVVGAGDVHSAAQAKEMGDSLYVEGSFAIETAH
jgi:hypothetical protein